MTKIVQYVPYETGFKRMPESNRGLGPGAGTVADACAAAVRSTLFYDLAFNLASDATAEKPAWISEFLVDFIQHQIWHTLSLRREAISANT